MTLTFNEYSEKSADTRIYSDQVKVIYPALGLCGESGEVAEKVKKVLRDDNGVVSDEKVDELRKEIGDVFWYLAALCSDLGLTLEEVAQANLDKLASRKERGKLSGSGDNR